MEKVVNNIKILTPCKVIYNKDDNPILILGSGDETLFYVSLVQRNAFKIGGTPEMQITYGCSAPFGFDVLFKSTALPIAPPSQTSLHATPHDMLLNNRSRKLILRAFLMAAFKDFESGGYGHDYKIILEYINNHDTEVIYDFIDAVYDFIMDEMEKDKKARS